MPRSTYLSRCHNIPALPDGWNWHLSQHTVDIESYVRPGVINNWTKLMIEITDRNDMVKGAHVVSLHTKFVTEHSKLVDAELVKGCYAAYRSMYPELKVSYTHALETLDSRDY